MATKYVTAIILTTRDVNTMLVDAWSMLLKHPAKHREGVGDYALRAKLVQALALIAQ